MNREWRDTYKILFVCKDQDSTVAHQLVIYYSLHTKISLMRLKVWEEKGGEGGGGGVTNCNPGFRSDYTYFAVALRKMQSHCALLSTVQINIEVYSSLSCVAMEERLRLS